ncbi:MAG: pyridoxal-dependent decarboxylase, partial [Sciscionella sp.]
MPAGRQPALGRLDHFEAAVTHAHKRAAWVHVDGAFGLWAAASASLRPLTVGVQRADSWATDAHKTLNVPYDCGIAIVAEPSGRSVLGVDTAYVNLDASGPGDALQKV